MVENFQMGKDHSPILDQYQMAKPSKISIVFAANTSLVDFDRYLPGPSPEG